MSRRLPPAVRANATCRQGDLPHAPHRDRRSQPPCPGVEPFPHDFIDVFWGSWRMVTICACGGYFESDEWEHHEAEHGLGVRT